LNFTVVAPSAGGALFLCDSTGDLSLYIGLLKVKEPERWQQAAAAVARNQSFACEFFPGANRAARSSMRPF